MTEVSKPAQCSSPAQCSGSAQFSSSDETSQWSDDQVRAAVERVLPETLASLIDHCRIASVSSLPEHDAEVERSAAWVLAQVQALGCDQACIITEGGKPAVIAQFPAPPGQPTVCLYAHHDVQPVGDPAQWTSDPFVATERGERLFGRGVADDKGGLAVHLAALRAFGGKPPVGVTLFIEGEEEIGSPSLATMVDRHADTLAADVFVIADSGNWEVGVPAFTTTLRGLADCVVEVSTLDHALHSGSFGGVVPDALTSLCRLLATLHDDRGRVAIDGLTSSEGPDLDYPEERLRAETGVLDQVNWIGEGSAVSRLWTQPSVSVLAIDGPRVAEASNTLQPTARAKVSLRVAPGDDAESALAALTRHLETHAPFGARVRVTAGETGQPGIIAFTGEVAEAATEAFTAAWGVEPVQTGQGGSIPMVATFQQQFPQASVLVTAVGDPDTRAHGIDESLHLDDWRKACLAETLLLARLAR